MQRILAIIVGGLIASITILAGVWLWSNLPNHDLWLLVNADLVGTIRTPISDPILFPLSYMLFLLCLGIWLAICFDLEDNAVLLFLLVLLIASGLLFARIEGLPGAVIEGDESTKVVIQVVAFFIGVVTLVDGFGLGRRLVKVLQAQEITLKRVIAPALPAALIAVGVVGALRPPTLDQQIGQLKQQVTATAVQQTLQAEPTVTAAAQQTQIAELQIALGTTTPDTALTLTSPPTPTGTPDARATDLAHLIRNATAEATRAPDGKNVLDSVGDALGASTTNTIFVILGILCSSLLGIPSFLLAILELRKRR